MFDVDEHSDSIDALRRNEARFRALFEGMLNGCAYCRMLYDAGGRPLDFVYLEVNPAFQRLTGLKSVAGKRVSEVIPGLRELSPELFEICGRVASGGVPETFDFEFKSFAKWLTVSAYSPAREYFVAVFEDITEHKRASLALQRENQRYKALMQTSRDGIHILDREGRLVEANPEFLRMLGYAQEEAAGLHVSDWDAQWNRGQLLAKIAVLIQDGGTIETRHRRKDGSLIDVEISVTALEIEGRTYLYNAARDITARKLAERELRESANRFRGLVEQSIAGIYIIQDGRFAYVNPRLAAILGYGSAAELIGAEALATVAEKDRALVAENIRRRGAGADASISYQFTGLRRDGSSVEVGVHGASAAHLGRPAIIGLMQDISEKKRADEQIRHYVTQLETAFMSTVGVVTTLSEMRDPYTAGHERRVAEIGVAIGAELGFDARRQEGLRAAGYLHDVGKITIPAEILSKPGKLSGIEFSLIQGHAQAAYDVLKDVDFPWPVAQIALQHHERMDGSGYPQGLKGEAILLEARITAVADVVEAMSSHRPYRPAFGIDLALAEIERGRGSCYDADVADACIKLFRERGYSLPA